jgi:hypothetical protein
MSPTCFKLQTPKVRRHVCCSQVSSRPEKIPLLWCTKTRATGTLFSYMGNRMIRVRSQAAGVRCASCTGEANRMWSAVCSLTSTAGRLPGEKMMPGGGVAHSRARIMGQSASGQRDRNLRSTLYCSQDPRRKHVSGFSQESSAKISFASRGTISYSHVS